MFVLTQHYLVLLQKGIGKQIYLLCQFKQLSLYYQIALLKQNPVIRFSTKMLLHLHAPLI